MIKQLLSATLVLLAQLTIATAMTYSVLPVIRTLGIPGGFPTIIAMIIFVSALTALLGFFYRVCFSETTSNRANSMAASPLAETILGLEFLSQSVKESLGRVDIVETVFENENMTIEYGLAKRSGRRVVVTRPAQPVQIEVVRQMKRDMKARQALTDVDGIAKIVDCGKDHAGRPYLAIEHEETVSLAQLAGSLSQTALVRLAKLAIQKVSKVHRRGVLINDLSIENLSISQNGTLFIESFACSTTKSGTQSLPIQLQSRCVAPELLQSPTACSRQADFFALGATLFELLTGTAFRTETEIANKRVDYTRINEGLKKVKTIENAEVCEIIRNCIEFRPSSRPVNLEQTMKRKNAA